MKKLFSLILVLALLCGIGTFALADGTVFKTQLTDGMDNSVSKWFGTSYNRATLTWLLIIDYMVAGNDISNIEITEDSYVAKMNDDVLMVVVKTTSGQISMTYSPGGGIAMFDTSDITSSALIEAALEQTAGKGNFERNSLSALNEVGQTISEALNS